MPLTTMTTGHTIAGEMKANRRSRKPERILIRYVPFFLLVLFIPLIVGGLIFLRTYSFLEQEVLKNRLSFLETIVETMDGTIREIDRMNLILSRDQDVQGLLSFKGDLTGGFPYWIIGAAKNVHNLRPDSDLILNAYLYPHANRLVIRNGTVFPDVARFRGPYFDTPGVNTDVWLNQIYSERYHRFLASPTVYINSGLVEEVIPYIQSIPVDSPYSESGTSVVTLGKKAVIELLGRLRLNGEGYAYMLNERGELIASTSDTQIIAMVTDSADGPRILSQDTDAGKLSISTMRSRYNRWTYAYVLPATRFWRQLRDIQTGTTISLSVVLVIGIIVSLLFSLRSSRPLVELTRLLGNLRPGYEPGVIDVPEFLKGSVSDLIKGNEFLRDAMEENRPFIRTAFLERLVRGELRSVEEAKALAERTSVNLEGYLHCVIVGRIQGYHGHMTPEELTEFEVKNTMIRELAGTIIGKSGIVFSFRDDEAVFLIMSPTGDRQQFEDVLLRLMGSLESEIAYKAGMNLRLGRGASRPSILDAHLSYAEARRALDLGKTAVFKAGHPTARSDAYLYPMESETRLLAAVEAGETAGVKAVFAELQVNAKAGNPDDAFMPFRLLRAMEMTLRRAIDRLSSMETIPGFQEKLHFAELETPDQIEYPKLLELFLTLAELVKEVKSGHYGELTKRIKEYVDANFADPQLCLWKIAGTFDLTDTYLCKLFKAHTGENLFGYIQNLRLTKAKELLDSSAFTVQEISVEVGYVNVSSFRRAFKRCFGVQPSTLRN